MHLKTKLIYNAFSFLQLILFFDFTMRVPKGCSVNRKCVLCSKTFCKKCDSDSVRQTVCAPCGDKSRRPFNYIKPNVLFSRLAEHSTYDFTLRELSKIHEVNILKSTSRDILRAYSSSCFRKEIERLDKMFGDLSKIRRVNVTFNAKV